MYTIIVCYAVTNKYNNKLFARSQTNESQCIIIIIIIIIIIMVIESALYLMTTGKLRFISTHLRDDPTF